LRESLAKILSTLVLVALAATTDRVHVHLHAPSEAELGESFVPVPGLVRSASFGFASLVADYYWLQAVQVVGAANFATSGSATHIGKLLDIVTELDPWVDHPYRFGAVWMNDSEKNVRHANDLLRRGISYHPGDWRDRFYLGFNQFYYLEDNEAAAETLEAAAKVTGAPPYLSALAVRLRAQGGGLDAAEIFLAELARREPEEYKRTEYEQALRAVETERRARFLDHARAEYQRRNGRDIAAVEDLLNGKSPVLREIPAEPNGEGWKLSEAGEIVSTFYDDRYVLHRSPIDEERRLKWRAEREAEAPAK
jgi:hypothetical protein